MLNEALNIVVTSLVTYVIWLLKKQRSDRTSANKAVALLLKRELNELHIQYIQQDSLTSAQYATFQDMYNTYHDLGGNGTATRWYNDINVMTIRD